MPLIVHRLSLNRSADATRTIITPEVVLEG